MRLHVYGRKLCGLFFLKVPLGKGGKRPAYVKFFFFFFFLGSLGRTARARRHGLGNLFSLSFPPFPISSNARTRGDKFPSPRPHEKSQNPDSLKPPPRFFEWEKRTSDDPALSLSLSLFFCLLFSSPLSGFRRYVRLGNIYTYIPT